MTNKRTDHPKESTLQERLIESLKSVQIVNGDGTKLSIDAEDVGREDWQELLKESDFTMETVEMSPEQFLQRVQHGRFTVDGRKVSDIYRDILGGNAVLPIPTMWFSDDYQWKKGFAPSWHDGSHRMLAIQKAGFTKVPVKIIY